MFRHTHSTNMIKRSSFRHFVQMTFGIQEGVLLSLLDTKFQLLLVQHGGMMSN